MPGSFRLDKISGGLNLRAHPTELAPGESCSLYDYVPDDEGLKRRPGDTVVQSQAFGGFLRVWGLNSRIFIMAGSAVWVSSGGAFTQLAAATSMTSFGDLVQAAASGGQGPFYFGNTGALMQTDGTAPTAAWTASGGALPVGVNHVVFVGNRVMLGGLTSNPVGAKDPSSTVMASGIGDPRDWLIGGAGGSWAVEFAPGDGEQISGMIALGSYVLVFKPSKAWLIYDTDTGANRPLGFGAGSPIHMRYLLTETPDGVFFFRKDGRLAVTDGTTVKPFDDRLAPLLNSYADPNPAANADVSAVYHRQHLYVRLGNFIYDWDFRLKSWWRHRIRGDGVASDGLRALVVAGLGGGPSQLYTLEGPLGGIQRLVRFMDDAAAAPNYGYGGAIVPQWRSSLLDLGTSDRKRLGALAIEGSGTADVGVFSNVTAGAIALDSEGFGYTPASQVASFPGVTLPTRTTRISGTPMQRALLDVKGAAALRTITTDVKVRAR